VKRKESTGRVFERGGGDLFSPGETAAQKEKKKGGSSYRSRKLQKKKTRRVFSLKAALWKKEVGRQKGERASALKSKQSKQKASPKRNTTPFSCLEGEKNNWSLRKRGKRDGSFPGKSKDEDQTQKKGLKLTHAKEKGKGLAFPSRAGKEKRRVPPPGRKKGTAYPSNRASLGDP